jgi:hypothetical protein
MGAALIVGAVFGAAMHATPRETKAPRLASEPDFFKFLKPMDATRSYAESTSLVGANANDSIDASPKPTTPATLLTAQASAQKMRALGAGVDEIYRMRAAALTSQTANRLARMESDEAAWKIRIDAYLAARARLQDKAPSATSADPAQALQQLRDAHFSAEEQQRLAAFETSPVPQLMR